MNILLFGKGGQVGWELQRSLSVLGSVTALDFDSTEHCGDFSNPAGVAETVRALRPDVIVNAAAHTAVDKAESEAEFARTLNATTPGALAQEAAKLGAWLVHYSTDYVFDGSGSRPWVETDTPAPLSVYGRTKLEGEQLIAEAGAKHLILRTSWVYAARGANFPRTMLRLAQEREQLRVVADQVGAPTGAELLADVSAHAIRSLLARPALAGTYHVAAAGETSWHGLARYAIEQGRALRPERPWKVRDIEAIATADYPTPARRPLNSRLDTRRLREAFGLSLPAWEAGVRRMLVEHLGTA